MYIFKDQPASGLKFQWIENSLRIGDCFDAILHCKMEDCFRVFSVLDSYGIRLEDSSRYVLVEIDTGSPWISNDLLIDTPNPFLTSIFRILGCRFSFHLFTSDGNLYALLLPDDTLSSDAFRLEMTNYARHLICLHPDIDMRFLISREESGRQGIFHAANSLRQGRDFFRFFREAPSINFLAISSQTALGSADIFSSYTEFTDTLCEQLNDEAFSPASAASAALALFRENSAGSMESLHRQMQMFSAMFLDKILAQSIVDRPFLLEHRIPERIMNGDQEDSYLTNLAGLFSEIQVRHLALARRFNTKFLHQVYQYIETHIGSPDLSVSRIAAVFHANRSQLTAKFREYYGQSLLECIRTKRLQRAIILIRAHPNRSLAQIAAEAGYCSQSTMYRSFQQYQMGTPSAYRSSSE